MSPLTRTVTFLMVIIINFNRPTLACQAATPSASPSVVSCTSCALSDLTLTPAGTVAGTTMTLPLTSAITTNAAGCNQIGLVCNDPSGVFGLFTFTGPAGSVTPANCLTPINPCVEQLTCNSSGQWTFSQAGTTFVVTTVTCQTS